MMRAKDKRGDVTEEMMPKDVGQCGLCERWVECVRGGECGEAEVCER